VLNQSVEILGYVGIAILSSPLTVGIPFGWGRKCAAWQRGCGVSSAETHWRAVSVPLLILLGMWFVYPGAHNHGLIFWLIILTTAASLAGLRRERRRHPEPSRTYRWSSEDDFVEPGIIFGYPVFDCWKCGAKRSGSWNYEATIQDKGKQEYAFAWMPICDECAEKAYKE
jgi:hypothetical protein